jgi:glucosamine kinase
MAGRMRFPSLMRVPRELLDGTAVSGRPYVVGVDGGATKTLTLLVDHASRRLWMSSTGPSNGDAVGVEAASAAIVEGVGDVLAKAGATAAEVGVAVLAVAGSIAETVGAEAGRALGLQHAYVVNDVIAAWAVGTRVSPGVAVISGTGSNMFGVNEAGESWRTGGWGHLLGDEGSGYWIGLAGLKASLRCRDGLGPETALLERALRHYRLAAIEDIYPLVYGKPLSNAEIAAFTREVREAAEEGDEVAGRIFAQAAHDLAAQTRTVIGAVGLAGGEFVVALIGGVFEAGAVIRAPFEREILEAAPRARFSRPELPPAAGAAMLALSAERMREAVADDRLWAPLAPAGSK